MKTASRFLPGVLSERVKPERLGKYGHVYNHISTLHITLTTSILNGLNVQANIHIS